MCCTRAVGPSLQRCKVRTWMSTQPASRDRHSKNTNIKTPGKSHSVIHQRNNRIAESRSLSRVGRGTNSLSRRLEEYQLFMGGRHTIWLNFPKNLMIPIIFLFRKEGGAERRRLLDELVLH